MVSGYVNLPHEIYDMMNIALSSEASEGGLAVATVKSAELVTQLKNMIACNKPISYVFNLHKDEIGTVLVSGIGPVSGMIFEHGFELYFASGSVVISALYPDEVKVGLAL